ncbi:PAS domain-containing protein [Rhodopirellula sp. SWK7]|uniref:PAS domain-containing protein n=1 Tax=Rhodopirellula sp. SWK7 TaxID=595460 RepID=UPI00034AC068|nr:PAS domain-containing protein [Rhodopirellula sp. SWK7]
MTSEHASSAERLRAEQMRAELEVLRTRLAEKERIIQSLRPQAVDGNTASGADGSGLESEGVAAPTDTRSQNHEHYQSLFENSPVPLWEEDFSQVKAYIMGLVANGIADFRSYFEIDPSEVVACARLIKVTDVNVAALRLFEANSKEELLANLSSTFTEASYKAIRERLIAIANGQFVFECEAMAKTLRGHDIDIYVKSAVVPGYGDSLRKVYLTTWDITEQKKAEKRLVESEGKFRGLYEQSPLAIQLYDLRGYLLWANQKTLDLFGVDDTSQLDGFNFWDDPNLSPENREALQRGEAVVVSATFNFDFANTPIQFKTSRTGIIYLDMYVIPLRIKGETTGYVVQIVEVTAQKKAEQELAKVAEERWHTLNKLSTSQRLREHAEHIGKAGSWERELATNRVIWSANMFDVFGVPPQEPTLDLLFSLIHPEEVSQWKRHFQEMIHHSFEPFEYDYRIVRPNGTIAWIHSVAEVLRDDNGTAVKLVGMAQDITERKQTEVELRQSERRLKEAQKVAHLGNWDLDVRTNQFDWSDEVYRIFGLEPNSVDVTYDSFLEFVVAEDRPTIDDVYHTLANNGKAEFEYRAIRQDGEMRWVSGRGEAYFSEAGEPLRMFGVVQDVTELRKAEEELHRIEWLLTKSAPTDASESEWFPHYGDLTELNTERTIAESVGKETLRDIAADLMALLGTSIAVFEVNGDYAFRVLQSDWIRLIDEKSREQCATRDNAEAIRSGRWSFHEDCWNCTAGPAIETGQPVDCICGCGSRVYAVPIRAGGNVVGAICVGYGTPTTDPSVLDTIAETLGVDVDSLRRAASTYEPRPKYIVEMAKERAASSARLIGEIVERRRSEERYRETQQQLLKQQDEAKRRVEEELERTRERLVRKTRLAAIGQLSGSIAHELRNPLSAVRNAAYFLKRHGLKEEDKTIRFLDVIDRQTTRADRIINNLLEMTRSKAPVTSGVDLHRAVNETLKQVEDMGDVRCRVVTTPDPFLFFVDAGQFKQVAANLIRNAVQAMDGNGELIIEATRNDADDVIVFRDNGPGIDADVRDTLFEPLVTSKTTGTGLGLSICRQIIERHGGTITVVEENGRGAAFQISLPRQPAQTGGAEANLLS